MGECVNGQRPDSAPPVAGWYPHPSSGTQLRWWDGQGWTDQHAPLSEDPEQLPVQHPAHPYPGSEIPAATEQRRWGTIWVWFLALSPMLSFATGFGALNRFVTTDAPAWHWAALLLLPYAAIVGAAVMDEHRLHTWHRETAPWAWACLGALPYLIARTVVLRRRGKFGSAPLWVALGSVGAALLVVVVMVAFFFLVINELNNATY